MKLLSGIYQIRHIRSGRVYIGSAVNLPSRRGTHIARLRRGQHHNAHLQAAWNKYGEAEFVFEVLVRVHASDLIAQETAFVERARRNERLLYNIRPVVQSNLGMKFGPEVRAKISKARMGGPSYERTAHTKRKQARASRDAWIRRRAAGWKPRVPPVCKVCRQPADPPRKGRCHTCNEYFRRKSKERPCHHDQTAALAGRRAKRT